MFLQFLQRCAAGGNGQDFCSDEFSTTHVERRVADDDNFLRLEIFPQQTSGAFKHGGGDMIAVFVVIRESAELEVLPESVTPQFQLRAQFDVAGEQAERGRFGQRLQVADESGNAVADFAVAVREDVVEPENVARKELRENSPAFRARRGCGKIRARG